MRRWCTCWSFHGPLMRCPSQDIIHMALVATWRTTVASFFTVLFHQRHQLGWKLNGLGWCSLKRGTGRRWLFDQTTFLVQLLQGIERFGFTSATWFQVMFNTNVVRSERHQGGGNGGVASTTTTVPFHSFHIFFLHPRATFHHADVQRHDWLPIVSQTACFARCIQDTQRSCCIDDAWHGQRINFFGHFW